MANPNRTVLVVDEQGNPIPFSDEDPSATLLTGSITASGTAQSLTTTTECVEVVLQSDPDNTTNVLVGNAANQFWKMLPGDNLTVPVDDASKVYVKAVSGSPVVNWFARL